MLTLTPNDASSSGHVQKADGNVTCPTNPSTSIPTSTPQMSEFCATRNNMQLPNSEQLGSGAGDVDAQFKLVTRKGNKEPIVQNVSTGKSGKVGPFLGATKHTKTKGKDTIPQTVRMKGRTQGVGSKTVS